MSFLFQHTRNRSGLSNGQGANPEPFSMQRHDRQSGGFPRIRTGGSMQVQRMLQRKPPLTVMERQEIFSESIQQQQRSHQGPISMAEVMEDLRILEEQQEESQRKLKAARLMKQRKINNHSDLEVKLRQSKYQHGQNRAELQRMYDKLSLMHHMLGGSRLLLSKMGAALRDFDGMLKKALSTKRRLLAEQRKKHAKIAMLRNKVELLDQIQNFKEQEVKSLQNTGERSKAQEEALRGDMDELRSVLQAVSNQTASLHSLQSRIENDACAYFNKEILKSRSVQTLKEQLTSIVHEHETVVANSYRNSTAHSLLVLDLKTTRDFKKARIMEESGIIQQIKYQWSELLQEGNEKLVMSNESACCIFKGDSIVNSIASSEAAECVALDDEKSACKTVSDLVQELQEGVVQVVEEEKQTKSSEETKVALFGAAEATERSRHEEYSLSIQQTNAARNEVTSMEETSNDLRKESWKKIACLEEESGGLHLAILRASDDLQRLEEKNRSMNSKAEKLSRSIGDAKKNHLLEVTKNETIFALTHDRSSELQQQIDEKEKLLAFTLDFKIHREENTIDKSIDDLKDAISAIQGEFPLLDQTSFKYDSTKSASAQATDALRYLVIRCNERLYSAQRTREELRAASIREIEEARVIAAAVEADKSRQSATRERRQNRLGDHQTSDHHRSDTAHETTSVHIQEFSNAHPHSGTSDQRQKSRVAKNLLEKFGRVSDDGEKLIPQRRPTVTLWEEGGYEIGTRNNAERTDEFMPSTHKTVSIMKKSSQVWSCYRKDGSKATSQNRTEHTKDTSKNVSMQRKYRESITRSRLSDDVNVAESKTSQSNSKIAGKSCHIKRSRDTSDAVGNHSVDAHKRTKSSNSKGERFHMLQDQKTKRNPFNHTSEGKVSPEFFHPEANQRKATMHQSASSRKILLEANQDRAHKAISFERKSTKKGRETVPGTLITNRCQSFGGMTCTGASGQAEISTKSLVRASTFKLCSMMQPTTARSEPSRGGNDSKARRRRLGAGTAKVKTIQTTEKDYCFL